MDHLPFIAKAILRLVNEKGIEYLLVGGHAVRFYGVPRETKDLDLWVPTDPVNAAKVSEVLQELGGDRPESTTSALSHLNRIVRVTLAPIQVAILDPIINQRPDVLETFAGDESLQVEFLTVQSGLDFQQAYAARSTGFLDGIPVSVVSLENLKIIKQTGGRTKDLADLDQLPVD